jgi:hypothetical protein
MGKKSIDPHQPVPVESMPGGRYSWVDNLDGTFNILDVPILAALPAGVFPRPVNKDPIDREWMERAIATAERREAEGHVGAVHVHHHDSPVDVESAGRLLITRVGKLIYDGEERDSLYAHLIRIPKVVFDRIKAGELPYRSIEGDKWEKHEITSLSLMPTETPYWRLPMLTLGDEVRQSYLSLALDKRYAVACSASGFSAQPAVGGQPVPDDKVIAEAPKPLPAQQSNPAPAAGTRPEQPAKAQQDQQKPQDGPPKEKKGGVGGKMKELFAMMMALVMSAIGEEEGEDKDPMDQRKADKAPPEQDPNPKAEAPAPVVAAAPVAVPAPEKPAEPVKAALDVPAVPPLPIPPPAQSGGTVKAVNLPKDVIVLQVANAELVAKVAALEGRVQAQVVVDDVVKDLADAEKALVGCNITPAIRAAMADQRKSGGKACLDAFVRVFATAALKDPPATLDAATQPSSTVAGAAPSGDDAILNELGPQSPETMKRAHELIACAAEYCKVARSGLTPREYVKYALKSEGLLRA